MIRTLLVANRAEVASRVFRTCRSLGIATVAVHSDADAGLPYVAEADVAVRLPGDAPADTYLRADLLLEAARRSGADAVHPGYGFLSENADFARAVEAAGLTWVGPDPASIAAMGDKIRAKQLMRKAGVPVLDAPGSPGPGDLPLIVKAAAGGGGRGMRVVRDLEVLDREVAAASAEALGAFGDGTVFLEPYVERCRHVEVQVVGDGRGGVLVLGERDCSVQRRHQKVLEESPAPDLSEHVRTALHDAARAAAAAIDYRGAGTVEFLLDPAADRFFFLEMNTRLQVEHPVTELVHGVDLVAVQLEVAEGGGGLETLAGARSSTNGGAGARSSTNGGAGARSSTNGGAGARSSTDGGAGARSSTNGGGDGHAIEVRLYAEDPADGYRPQSGTLTAFEIPAEEGVRVDTGYVTGSVVSTHYDAMLAKVVVHAPTRTAAARRLAGVLRRSRLHGVRTNRDQLVAVLGSPAFLEARLSTRFLEDHPPPSPVRDPGAAVAAALALAERARAARTVQQGLPVAWRNVPSRPQLTELLEAGADEPVRVAWWGGRDGYAVAGHRVVAAGPTSVTLETDGVATTYAVAVREDVVDLDSAHGHVTLTRVPRFVDPATAVAGGSLLAPMPGTVVSVLVEQGAEVAAGQAVLVLEAMKMQHTVTAPRDGTVVRLDVGPGAQVAPGQVLAVVEEA